MKRNLAQRAVRLVAVLLIIGAVTAFYRATGFANATTVSLTYLLVVLGVATRWGLLEAIVASILATLFFNYFFLPPVHTWVIDDPQNWVSLFVLLVVSIVGSQLSERTRRMALERALAQKAAAEAELVRKSEEFKSTLLDAFAHELRTPLTSLKASVSALRTTASGFSAGQREFLAIVEEETDRLNRLVSEMLQMARVEAGKLVLSRAVCSVEALIWEALEDAKRLLEGRRAEAQISPALPGVIADPELIRTVLRHLLDNAAKYSKAGAPVRILAEQRDSQVCICVADEGPGLAEEELSRVFERHYRGSGPRASVPGTGLGLAIARGIISAHGGRIWAESSPGQGTRFSFTLPAASENALA